MTDIIQELEQFGVDGSELRSAARKELKRRLTAERYLNDPWLFLKMVCTEPTKRLSLNSTLHGGGLKFINGPKRRKLILWPRGHLKSTTFTMGEALRRAVKNPNIRILISSAKWDNAKSFLAGIKGILREPTFIDLYGNLLPPPNDKFFKNNDAMLSLTSKTVDFKQATFSTTGLDAEKTSQHYDLIIHDDVVARDNVSTEVQMMKVIQYYRDCVSLLDPKREMWVIGTRWHPLDLYGWLIEGATDMRCRETDFNPHHPECRCRFDVSIRSLIEDGSYIYPEKFDDEVMSDLIESDQLDRYTVACQYYNNPADPSTCWFKATDIEASLINPNEVEWYYEGDKRMKRPLVWYAAIDPAESSDSRACMSASVAVGVDQRDGMWYVDWAEGRRVETPGFLDLCMETYRKYKPAKFGMELHTKRSLDYSLKRRQLDDQMVFPIEELKPQKVGDPHQTKEQRIKRLLPLFEQRKIKINKVACKALVDEMYTIPASKTRDRTDALSYILDLVPPGMGAQHKDIHLPKRYVHFQGTGY